MTSLTLRRPEAGKRSISSDAVIPMFDVLLGYKGGGILLRGHDGKRLNQTGGATLSSNNYNLDVQSTIGNHAAFVLSATSSTAAPTAANSALLVTDAGITTVGAILSGALTLAEIATPANPAAANQKLYAKTGLIARLTSAGVESRLLDGSQFTAAGQLITSTASNVPSVLSMGTAYQNLGVNSGATALAYQASLQSLMTTTGDIVGASAANTPARIASATGVLHGAAGVQPSYSTVATADLAANAVTQNGFAAGSSGAQTTTSATYVDLTDMSVTLTTVGGDLLVWFFGSFFHSVAGQVVVAALSLDGAAEVAGFGANEPAISYPFMIATVYRFTGVAAGSHTIKARWLTGAATATAAGNSRFLLCLETKR